MNIIDKVSDSLTQSVDFIIDKNRQAAQLNRLKAIIKSETEILNDAYIALGKQYLKVLDGKTETEVDVEKLRETVTASKQRIKKARARYEYILKNGIPKTGVDVTEAAEEDTEKTAENTKDKDSEEDQDITIAYADPTAACESDAIDAKAEVAKDEAADEKTEAAKDETQDTEKTED